MNPETKTDSTTLCWAAVPVLVEDCDGCFARDERLPFARFPVTQQLLSKLQRLHFIIKEEDITTARITFYEAIYIGSLKVEREGLEVYEGGFYLSAATLGGWEVESETVGLQDFLEAVRAAKPEQMILFTDEGVTVYDQVTDDISEALSEG